MEALVPRPKQEEVGNLFVTENSMTVKLMPSKKVASKAIHWFHDGAVTDRRKAAREIQQFIGRLQGKSRVVRGLTLGTDKGVDCDLMETGLIEVVSKAGFEPLSS
jgi:hypothetical protein